jgi:nitrite reductase (NO-forming)
VQLTDEQVAHVLTYVSNSWGNTGDAVSPDEVRLVREDHQ